MPRYGMHESGGGGCDGDGDGGKGEGGGGRGLGAGGGGLGLGEGGLGDGGFGEGGFGEGGGGALQQSGAVGMHQCTFDYSWSGVVRAEMIRLSPPPPCSEPRITYLRGAVNGYGLLAALVHRSAEVT